MDPSIYKVSIINKIGAFFRLPLPNNASLENIHFDFSDSLLLWGSVCQNRRTRSCEIIQNENGIMEVKALQNDCECRPVPQPDCVAHHSLSLFEAPKSSTINALKLKGVHFSNIYSNYNSLLPAMNDSGEHFYFEVIDSVFEDISICGALISSHSTSPSTPFSKLFEESSQPQALRIGSIFIHNSTFIRLGNALSFSNIQSLQSRFYADTRANFDSMGIVLELDNFPGPITLTSNNFKSCKLPFRDILSPQAIPPIESAEPGSLITFQGSILTHGLLVVTNHSEGFFLISNTFTDNSALRGLVVGTLAPIFEQGFLLFNNTFERNLGAFSAALLNLLALSDPDPE